MQVPVVIFSYNRPHLLKEVLDQVSRYHVRKLYFVSDGPRNAFDHEGVEACRRVFESYTWTGEVEVLFRERNLGCGLSIRNGLDHVFLKEEAAIILEDDCVPSDGFFGFVEGAISRYGSDPTIFMVSGLNELGRWPPVGGREKNLFSLGGIWGWATWADRWKLHSSEFQPLNAPDLSHRMGAWKRKGVPPRRLRQVVAGAEMVRVGDVDTWDYQWALTRLYHGGVTVIPSHNLIENVGVGADATHMRSGRRFPKAENVGAKWEFRKKVRLDLSYIWVSEAVRIIRQWDARFSALNSKVMHFHQTLRSKFSPRSLGEPFLSYRDEKRKAKGSDITNYIWSQKPPQRQRVPSEVILEAQKLLPVAPGQNLSVLEVGPGTGRFLREVISTFRDISEYGVIEADPEWASYCEMLITQEASGCEPRISVNATGDFSMFCGREYDLVHAHAVLVQVRITLGLRLISEMAKLLKPNGVMVFDVYSSRKLQTLTEMGSAVWSTYYHPDWLRSAVTSNGLEVVRRSKHFYGQGGATEYWFVKNPGRK